MALTKQQQAAVDETLTIFDHLWAKRHDLRQIPALSILTQAVMANLNQQRSTETIYKANEAAKLLKVNVGTLYHLIETRQLQATRIKSPSGKRDTYRITQEAIDAFLHREDEPLADVGLTHLRFRKPKKSGPKPDAA